MMSLAIRDIFGSVSLISTLLLKKRKCSKPTHCLLSWRVQIYLRSSRKLIQPGRLVSDTRSLVWREGQSALMASTCGARASLVMMDLALAACSRYLRSFPVSWETPGIMTTPWVTQRREIVRSEGRSEYREQEKKVAEEGWKTQGNRNGRKEIPKHGVPACGRNCPGFVPLSSHNA